MILYYLLPSYYNYKAIRIVKIHCNEWQTQNKTEGRNLIISSELLAKQQSRHDCVGFVYQNENSKIILLR